MFRRKPAPDLIRGGNRFADKNMRQSMILEHVPIPKERDMLERVGRIRRSRNPPFLSSSMADYAFANPPHGLLTRAARSNHGGHLVAISGSARPSARRRRRSRNPTF